MKPTIRLLVAPLMLAGALSIYIPVGAQQATQSVAQRLQSYDVKREVNLLGTVVKYDAASSAPPIGAHLLLQTSSGQVDVHLGNAKVLQANHFELNPGDRVRIIGEDLAYGDGAFFAARIMQKGTQAVAVRNTKGALGSPAATMSPVQIETLRGVR
jgi:hypothetical protein